MYCVLAVCVWLAVSQGVVQGADSNVSVSEPEDNVNRNGNKSSLNFANKHLIISGKTAAIGQFPWQAAIKTNGKLAFCAGTIIASKWVLTAGQCVSGATKFQLTFGSLYRAGSPGSVFMISMHSVLHESYQFEADKSDAQGRHYFIENDIGLIQLPEPLIWSKTVAPVRLPKGQHIFERIDGETVRVAGWGWSSHKKPLMSPVLLYADLVVINNELCEISFQSSTSLIPIIGPSHLCTNTKNGRSTFSGDTGGPLLWQDVDGQYRQMGIISFMDEGEEGPAGYPNGFTRITSHLDWIEAHTGIDPEPRPPNRKPNLFKGPDGSKPLDE